VVPTFTVIVEGEKLMPLMSRLTVVPPVPPPPPVPRAPPPVLPDLLQKTIVVPNKKQKIKVEKMFFLFINTVFNF
jgi:hypothetical protein